MSWNDFPKLVSNRVCCMNCGSPSPAHWDTQWHIQRAATLPPALQAGRTALVPGQRSSRSLSNIQLELFHPILMTWISWSSFAAAASPSVLYFPARFSWIVPQDSLQQQQLCWCLLMFADVGLFEGTVDYELEGVSCTADWKPTEFGFRQSNCCHHVGPVLQTAASISRRPPASISWCWSSRGEVVAFNVCFYQSLLMKLHVMEPQWHGWSTRQQSGRVLVTSFRITFISKLTFWKCKNLHVNRNWSRYVFTFSSIALTPSLYLN